MLQSACLRDTHTFKQLTYKKTENPPRTPKTEKQTQLTQQRGNKDKRKRETRNATNRTDDDRRAAKATAEAKKEKEENQKDGHEKEPTRPPGPLQTTQGQDQQKDLDPGVGMQGAGGSNLLTEKETLQKNPCPTELYTIKQHQTAIHKKKTRNETSKGPKGSVAMSPCGPCFAQKFLFPDDVGCCLEFKSH